MVTTPEKKSINAEKPIHNTEKKTPLIKILVPDIDSACGVQI